MSFKISRRYTAEKLRYEIIMVQPKLSGKNPCWRGKRGKSKSGETHRPTTFIRFPSTVSGRI